MMTGYVALISRTILAGVTFIAASLALAEADQRVDPAIASRFEYLGTNGNSNCSQAFMEAISMMPATERLRGSCCSPMDLARYASQTEGLKKYSDIAAIPPDPYDIEVALAQHALSNYDVPLNFGEQRAYDYAMAHSAERGPCCCRCWRWKVYGGLAKYLIHVRGFTGSQITEVWNLSDGCGGGP